MLLLAALVGAIVLSRRRRSRRAPDAAAVAARASPSLLFAIGVYGVLARRNAMLVLMGVELMLNAVNLNLVAFDA